MTEPRFWILNDPSDNDGNSPTVWLEAGELVGIVDEEMGGTILFCHESMAPRLLAALESLAMLDDGDHLVEVTVPGRWTMQHPLQCRPNLLGCLVNAEATRTGLLEFPPGKHRIRLGASGIERIGDGGPPTVGILPCGCVPPCEGHEREEVPDGG